MERTLKVGGHCRHRNILTDVSIECRFEVYRHSEGHEVACVRLVGALSPPKLFVSPLTVTLLKHITDWSGATVQWRFAHGPGLVTAHKIRYACHILLCDILLYTADTQAASRWWELPEKVRSLWSTSGYHKPTFAFFFVDIVPIGIGIRSLCHIASSRTSTNQGRLSLPVEVFNQLDVWLVLVILTAWGYYSWD